ncbi:MAG: hypothetical protein NC098_07210 [Lachnoclostridium sp.]|nr:hypothetical protein [Lachnoclostridium sp.]
MNYRIFPPDGWIEATVRLPLSKSMSARALVINALAGMPLSMDGMAGCDDTRAIFQGLQARDGETVNVGQAGTAMRFLTAYYAAMPGREVKIDGDERMRQRPIGPLVEALRATGADIDYIGSEGYAPLKIRGRKLEGGDVTMDASVSSQFVSAIMMVAPLMTEGLKITLRGEIVSLPYIKLTMKMMEQAGADADFYGGDTVEIRPAAYEPTQFDIQPDWSAASPWYEVAALSGGEIAVENLPEDSHQPDREAAAIFDRLGVATDFHPEEGDSPLLMAHPDADARLDHDFSPNPDLVQAAAVTCCMLGMPFHFTGLSTLSIKECDRVEALVKEMAKVGAMLERPAAGELLWDGRRRPITELPRFATYGDHRMAMALAPVSILMPGIVVEDVETVTKSYPAFWDELQNAGFTLLDGDAPLPVQEDEDAES